MNGDDEHDKHGEDDKGASTPPAPAPRVRAADADRDAVLTVLGDAHAAGRLDVHELDERQSGAMHARHLDELPSLIADLPEGAALAERLRAQAGGTHPGSTAGGALGGTGTASHAVSPFGQASGTRGENNLPALPGGGTGETSVAILSGREIMPGPGTPSVTSIAMMGGDNIFLRDVMGPGVQVTVTTYLLMAGCDVFVPPGVRVIDKTVNIMAGNKIDPGAMGDGSNGTLILSGVNIMAGNDVKLDSAALPPGTS